MASINKPTGLESRRHINLAVITMNCRKLQLFFLFHIVVENHFNLRCQDRFKKYQEMFTVTKFEQYLTHLYLSVNHKWIHVIKKIHDIQFLEWALWVGFSWHILFMPQMFTFALNKLSIRICWCYTNSMTIDYCLHPSDLCFVKTLWFLI